MILEKDDGKPLSRPDPEVQTVPYLLTPCRGRVRLSGEKIQHNFASTIYLSTFPLSPKLLVYKFGRLINIPHFAPGIKMIMWPSGQARVCKTFYGGSNPPMISLDFHILSIVRLPCLREAFL